MNNPNFHDLARKNDWVSRREAKLSDGVRAANQCAYLQFKELINRETRDLCDRDPPQNSREYDAFVADCQKLTDKFGAIHHADQRARTYPEALEELLDVTRQFLSCVSRGGDVAQERGRHRSEVSAISHKRYMKRLRGR